MGEVLRHLQEMIVIACGMRRSASTLQYHIAREIVWYNGGYDAGFMSDGARGFEKVAKQYANDLAVCKVHMYLPGHSKLAGDMLASGQAKAVYIYRHPLDVAASIKRFRPQNFHNKNWAEIASVHRKWVNQKNCYVSKYDDVVADIKTEMLSMAEFLSLPMSDGFANLTAEILSFQSQKARLPKKGLDRENWLWDNHMSTGKNGLWKTELTAGEINRVRGAMSDIIEEYQS